MSDSIEVTYLDSDAAVLCAVIAGRSRAVAVVNPRYPEAEAHARAHVAAAREAGKPGCWVCGPECAG